MVSRQKKRKIICDAKFFKIKNGTNLKIKNVHVIYIDIVTNDDIFTPKSPQIYL